MYITGDKLPKHLQEEILRSYIYRWTTGNTRIPEVYRNISTPTMDKISDEEWLAQHAFAVTKRGKLSTRSGIARPAYWAD